MSFQNLAVDAINSLNEQSGTLVTLELDELHVKSHMNDTSISSNHKAAYLNGYYTVEQLQSIVALMKG